MNDHRNDKITDSLVNTIISEGVNINVWGKRFSPTGCNDFKTYMRERMRNDRKYNARLDLKKNQKKRFSSMMDSSIASEAMDESD